MALEEFTVAVVFPATLFAIMFALGSDLTPKDFGRIFKEPAAMIVGLSCQLIALPLIAIGIAIVVNLPQPVALGLVLLAACPGGVMSNALVYFARAEPALSVSMTAISSVVILFSLPIVMAFGVGLLGAEGEDIQLSASQTFGQLFVITLLPLVLGMVFKGYASTRALRLQPFFRVLSLIAILCLALFSTITNVRLDPVIFPSALGAGIALAVIGMATGFLASLLIRADARRQVTIMIEIAVQNVAVAVVVALSILDKPALALVAAIYGLAMILTAALLLFFARKKLEPTRA